MDKIKSLISEMNFDRHITIDDIPNIDLYMDQVIQLFESTYSGSKRDDEEKILTKTMINNYAKGKLFFPIKNKKYSKEHILLISFIYQLKGALSISDIKSALNGLNDKITKEEDFILEDFYEKYLQMAGKNYNRFALEAVGQEKEVQNILDTFSDKDREYLETFLLVASFANMSNMYRRAAEKLVDSLNKEKEK